MEKFTSVPNLEGEFCTRPGCELICAFEDGEKAEFFDSWFVVAHPKRELLVLHADENLGELLPSALDAWRHGLVCHSP